MQSLMTYPLATNLDLSFLEAESQCDVLSCYNVCN